MGTYTSHVSYKASAGVPTFDYDALLRSRPRSSWTVHEDLDAKKLNTAGQNVREAFDSDEHPNATPIAIIFDVTGSMGGIPAVLQQKLPQLHGLLQRKGYVEDPQILFGAVGDAYSDRLPLQIGQFESDNRMDEQLEHIVLEGGGGGGNHESYQLAAYYMARHADLDCVKKRGKKGYLFLIGDERLYSRIDRRQVEELIGDHLEEELTTKQVFEELKEKFEVFFLFAAQGSYQPEGVLFKDTGRGWDHYGSEDGVCYWRDLLGQNALILEDAEAVCETIALTLGLMEGTVSLDEGVDDLKDIGADLTAITAASKAVAVVGASVSAVAKTTGDLPDLPDRRGGTTRL
jgi:hypothetical protein